MKRLVGLILLIGALLSLASCGETEYDPIASTEEEAAVVYTLKIGEKSYDVKYELYRAFFLNLKSSVDGGDGSVWTGENKNEYIEKIDALVMKQIADIYSVFYEAEAIGINPYSSEYNSLVKKYVRVGVEGGEYDGIILDGFGGSYEKYLASLKAANMNYSVQDLLIRYTLAYGDLIVHYAGVENESTGEITGEHLDYTEDDVWDFYWSDDCVRILRARLPLTTSKDPEALRDDMIDAARYGDDMVRQCVGEKSQTLVKDVDNGEPIGRYSLDPIYYGELTDAAFGLGNGDVSEVITINTDTDSGYAILYRLSKANSHFYDCYGDIREVYKQHVIGKMLNDTALKIIDAAEATELLATLDRASISIK